MPERAVARRHKLDARLPMLKKIQVHCADPRLLLVWYGLASLVAIFTCFYGLGSDHIPKNGDEFPYEQITRLTAASGHLLPLRSEDEQLRNTKPPLLFWQGIASTNWGSHWTLWRLRWPSVVYTLLTALLVFLLSWKLSGQTATGFVGFLTFLAFFSTYRYGRPFLTDPPVVFWLFLALFVLLFFHPAILGSSFLGPLCLGAAIGVGLLYKSFALAAPVLLCLAWWYLHQRSYRVAAFLAQDSWKLALVAGAALGLFSLWFILDPNPQAIWKQFVVGENVGKFGARGGSYWLRFLWGGSSIWRLVVSYPLDAGLLAFPVAALFLAAWRRRDQLGDGEKLLWGWVITLFVVFGVPSQRDERYLLPGMPALAVLCALNWGRIDRRAWVASLAAAGAVLAVLAWLSLRLERGMSGVRLYPMAYWALLAGAGTLVLLALFVPGFTRPSVNLAILLVFLSFAAFLRPFDGPLGVYSAEVRQYVKGKRVWVPVNFRAKEEGYRFLLPGAEVQPYRYTPGLTIAQLSARYPLFAIKLPMTAPGSAKGRVIGQRLDLSSRHNSSQIREMLRGKVLEHLFLKELLIEAPRAGPDSRPNPNPTE